MKGVEPLVTKKTIIQLAKMWLQFRQVIHNELTKLRCCTNIICSSTTISMGWPPNTYSYSQVECEFIHWILSYHNCTPGTQLRHAHSWWSLQWCCTPRSFKVLIKTGKKTYLKMQEYSNNLWRLADEFRELRWYLFSSSVQLIQL